MSKRNIRRFAAVAGVALAVGTMAPAMAAINLGGGAEADVNVDAFALLDDVTGSLPIGSLPELGDITSLLAGVNGLVMADASGILGTVTGNTTTILGSVTAPVTANVANVTGTSAAIAGNVSAIANTAVNALNVSEVTANVLGGGILSGNTVNLPALGLPTVPGVPGLGFITGLLGGGLLDIDLDATGSVNVLSAVLGSL